MKKHIIGTLLLGGWCLMMLTLLQSCDKQEVFSYESEHALFFERWKQVSLSERYRLDTVNYSFSHYVGVEDIEHQFKINLIGNLLEEDAEYKVIVVDSLTTGHGRPIYDQESHFPKRTFFRFVVCGSA